MPTPGPTPGPWKVEEDEDGTNNPDILICNENDEILAEIGGGSPETTRANARLMAAAPVLLAALEMIDLDNPAVRRSLGFDGVYAVRAALAAVTPKTKAK